MRVKAQMNVLSKLLDEAVKRGVFKYHPRCKKIGLAHLCFTDDLLIFSEGNLDSLCGIKGVLEKFYKMSGLVRYLGVPLVTRRLSEKDCHALLEKIRDKLEHWANKRLSYAGRLQLIRSVLFNVTNYWCRKLVLPNSMIQKVDQLFQLLRKILGNEGFLWVAWAPTYVMGSVDFWSFEVPSSMSWGLRRIFALRGEVHCFLAATPPYSKIDPKVMWEELRPKRDCVPWQNLIWFSLHVPRHVIIAWLAVLGGILAPLVRRKRRLFGLLLASSSHFSFPLRFYALPTLSELLRTDKPQATAHPPGSHQPLFRDVVCTPSFPTSLSRSPGFDSGDSFA
ncbi:uncharacterized protein LOC120208257 [Hibiscus syriacus]|uniref:uncharacterized protein LOC120208257 n=1 Tax=Hibiscus syriacus TaxID=106335 RepID=UPI001921EA6F|nr:uncharacterized protein LOC120208257 [Hibiscus syriacus]